MTTLSAPLLADDGEPDPTFSDDGTIALAWANGNDQATAVAAATDGSIFVGGAIGAADGDDIGVARLTASGTSTLGWGVLGRRVVAFDAVPDADDTLSALAPDADGSVRVAGLSQIQSAPSSQRIPAIVRLDPAGDRDPLYAGDGLAEFPLPADWLPVGAWGWTGAVVQRDGKIVFYGVCAGCDGTSGLRPMLLRVGVTGGADPTFSGDGWQLLAAESFDGAYVWQVALDGQDRLLVLAAIDDTQHLARLTSAGAVDAAYGGGDGVVTFALPFGGEDARRLAVDPRTNAVIVGFDFSEGPFEDHFALLRLDASGTPDGSFGTDGEVEIVDADATELGALQIQSDGRIVGVGSSIAETPSGNDRAFLLFRLTPQGQYDVSFGGGLSRIDFGLTDPPYAEANVMTLSAGRIVAAGRVEVAEGEYGFGVVRARSQLVFTDGFEAGSANPWL